MKAGTILIAAAALLPVAAHAGGDEQPICADRPSKSTGECTVPAGRVQVETGLVDWTHDHLNGVTSDVAMLGSSLIKYGIGDRADLELGLTPIEFAHWSGAGVHEHAAGFGDMAVRVKYALTPDDAPFLVGLDPFVKLPTANHHLGNGKVEGGLLVPMSAQLGKSGLTLSIDPELDWLSDEDGHGHHASMIQVINLGATVTKQLSVSAELWGQWNWDPQGTGKQRSIDGSVAYLVKNDLQLDAGANFGLNRDTPDSEFYLGISKRF